MSNVGSSVLPIESKPHRHQCICGQPTCARIRACFQSIGDARGAIMTLPALGGSRCVGIKEFKLKRICHHLGLGENNYAHYASVDRRDRSADAPLKPVAQSTRAFRKNNPLRSKKCIAVHHFHPEVVRRFTVEGKKLMFLDYLPESFVVEAGLWQNGYAEDDYFPDEDLKIRGKSVGRVFAPVPNYDNALEDYRRAAIRYKIEDIIESCDAATRCRTLLSELDVDDDDNEGTLEPAARIGKFSMNVQDMQRAICMLAGDVEQLKLENRRLEQQLETEKNRNDNAALEDYLITNDLAQEVTDAMITERKSKRKK